METDHFSFEILEKDMVRSQFLHLRPRAAMRVLGLALLIVTIAVLSLTIVGRPSRQSIRQTLGISGGVVGLAIYFLVLIPRKARKLYRQQKVLHGEKRLSFSSNGLSTASEYGEVSLPWATFVKWKEDSELFLLYHSDMMFTLLPKRYFPSAQHLSNFRALLSERVRNAA